MNKAALLMAASVAALLAGGASSAGLLSASPSAKAGPVPKANKLLYNQNSTYGGSFVNSENFTSGSSGSFSDQGADDFVIPKGRTWAIREVDVSGLYYDSTGPANSENVIFYKDRKGMPGKPVRKGTFSNLHGTDTEGNFAVALPRKGITLRAGTYWVSVIANMDFQSEGIWSWDINGVQHGNQAMWQNPEGGWGICQTWGTIENCADTGPDFMFALRGSSKR